MKTITQHTKTYGMHQKQYNRRFHNDKCLHLKKKKNLTQSNFTSQRTRKKKRTRPKSAEGRK